MPAKCTIANKFIYTTREEARALLWRLRKRIMRKRDGRRIKHRMPKPVKIRIYQCPYCNGLHFTSMDYNIYKKLLEKERYRQIAESKDNVNPLDAVGTDRKEAENLLTE